MTRTPREIVDDPTTPAGMRYRVRSQVLRMRIRRHGWPEDLAWSTPIGPRGRRAGEKRGVPTSPWARASSPEPTWEEVAAFVDEHPDGATHEEIGVVLGLCRERVRQIEADALRKIGAIMRGHEAEVLEMLAARGQIAEAE